MSDEACESTSVTLCYRSQDRSQSPGHRVPRRDPARVLEVPRDNPWLVRDLDTPADLAEARAWLATGRGG